MAILKEISGGLNDAESVRIMFSMRTRLLAAGDLQVYQFQLPLATKESGESTTLNESKKICLAEHFSLEVLGRELGCFPIGNRPDNPDLRVIPTNRALLLRGIVFCAFVLEVRGVAEDKKSMGEAGRNPETLLVLRTQDMSIPCSKGGRTLAEIDKDIKDGSLRHPDQFALRPFDLIMESSQDIFG